MIPLSIRKSIINSEEDGISICKQCELLSVARSTLYYTPSKTNNQDLQLMAELDKLHLEDPTRGTRRMSKELKKLGYDVGRYLFDFKPSWTNLAFLFIDTFTFFDVVS